MISEKRLGSFEPSLTSYLLGKSSFEVNVLETRLLLGSRICRTLPNFHLFWNPVDLDLIVYASVCFGVAGVDWLLAPTNPPLPQVIFPIHEQHRCHGN